jgi:hypothetical protein
MMLPSLSHILTLKLNSSTWLTKPNTHPCSTLHLKICKTAIKYNRCPTKSKYKLAIETGAYAGSGINTVSIT